MAITASAVAQLRSTGRAAAITPLLHVRVENRTKAPASVCQAAIPGPGASGRRPKGAKGDPAALTVGAVQTTHLALSAKSADFIFFLSPVVSGLAVVATALLYPVTFRPLAQWSLLGGSYVACLILLAVPLVFLSSLNPILIAYLNRISEERAIKSKDRPGSSKDGGSGLELLLSTIGSVAGVVVAALIVIPNVMNFHGLLLIGGTLCILAAVAASFRSNIARKQRWAIYCVSGIGTIAAGLASLYLYPGSVGRQVELSGHDWRIVANQPSIFGAFTVVEEKERAAGSAHGTRILIQNGLMQNGVEGNGEPYFLFTRALEVLGLGVVPDANSALVLGLAAGLLPMRLSEKHVDTDIVEIEPRVTDIAEAFFDFDRNKFNLFFEDARTFVSACPRKYDLVFVDLFHGDGMPEHLVTKEFFLDVRSCLTERGALVMNTFFDAANFEPQRSLMATIVDVFEYVVFYQEGVVKEKTTSNGFLLSLRNEPVKVLKALRLDKRRYRPICARHLTWPRNRLFNILVECRFFEIRPS